MPSITAETTSWQAERAELQAVLESPLFVRSPALTHLLSYLCEKTFAGETDQIKEYSIALDVFDRRESFDQDTDSIVRVHANRLRKRLSEYYAAEGASHALHIAIPVGQYVPLFQSVARNNEAPMTPASSKALEIKEPLKIGPYWRSRAFWFTTTSVVVLCAAVVAAFIASRRPRIQKSDFPAYVQQPSEPPVGLPVGEEVHLLAGSARKYVDHAGKLWSPDGYFSGGMPVASSVQHIWRTQDPIIYRNSRQGDFTYDIH